MPKGKKKKNKNDDGRLTDGQVFTMAREYLDEDAREKQAKTRKTSISEAIAAEFEERGIKAQTSEEHGLKVTRVQNETVVIDGEGLYDDLTAAQRRDVYDYSIVLTNLSEERQREVQAVLRDALTRAELQKVRVPRLNENRLSEAVQAGKITAAKVAAHSTIRKAKAFIRVSVAGEGA